MENGECVDGGRWCVSCSRYHGILYECPAYPEEIKMDIRYTLERSRRNLSDPEWIAREIEKGTPPEVIMIMRCFAGLPPDAG